MKWFDWKQKETVATKHLHIQVPVYGLEFEYVDPRESESKEKRGREERRRIVERTIGSKQHSTVSSKVVCVSTYKQRRERERREEKRRGWAKKRIVHISLLELVGRRRCRRLWLSKRRRRRRKERGNKMEGTVCNLVVIYCTTFYVKEESE